MKQKQLRNLKFGIEKDTYKTIFFLLAGFLAFLPFITTFQDVLTRFVISLDFYKIIQNYVVPWEVRMVAVMLWPFGFQPRIVGEYLAIGGEKPLLVEIAWNCIGWQSMVFFLLTGWIGFQGDKYTHFSKIKTWMIGFLGTFLVNLLRISVVALLAYYFGQSVAIIFHDYGSTLAVIMWLFVYWWFAYNYILDEKYE